MALARVSNPQLFVMADLVAPVLIVLVLGMILVGVKFTARRGVIRKLSQLPRIKVSELQPGTRVKVAGTVRLRGEALVSPVYQQACAYWHVEVLAWEWSRSQQTMSWYSLRTKQQQMDFVLSDETGEVRVAVDYSHFHATTAQFRAAEHDPELPPHLVRFLEEHGHARKDDKGRARVFGFDEAIIADGEAVEIVGTVQSDPDGGLVLAGTLKAPLLVLDAEP